MSEVESKVGNKINIRTSFKVYDMPQELMQEYIGWAKLYYGNQVWKVMEAGLKALKDKMINIDVVMERIENFEKKAQSYQGNVDKYDAQVVRYNNYLKKYGKAK